MNVPSELAVVVCQPAMIDVWIRLPPGATITTGNDQGPIGVRFHATEEWVSRLTQQLSDRPVAS